MGIQGLNEFIKKEAEKKNVEYKGTGNLSDLAGQRVAIDMGNLINICIYNAKRECVKRVDLSEEEPPIKDVVKETIVIIVDKLTSFLESGVVPICCFDGVMDKKKQHAWKKREKSRDVTKEKYEEIKKAVKEKGPLDRSEHLLEEYRKRYCSILEPSLKKDIIIQLKKVLDGLGAIYLTPGDKGLKMNGEAETLCAHLVINGLCQYVFSNDSDLYVYGVPYMMTSVRRNYSVKGDRKVVEYIYEYSDTIKAIQILGFTDFSQFQEFCVMCGTDYNPNIFRIGPAKARKLIQQHGSIDSLPIEGKEILDHKYVLSIFHSANVTTQITDDDLFISKSVADDIDLSEILFESEPKVIFLFQSALEKFRDKSLKALEADIAYIEESMATSLIF